MQHPLIKICGMTDIDNISKILFLEPDFLGFIFYPKSPRYVVGKLKPEMLSIIPESVKRVGVFVNSSEAEMRQTASTYGLKVIQLHGEEKPTVCKRLREEGFEVIKAFSIESEQDFEKVWEYTEHVDYFLFDTKTPGYGGSGQEFDWQLILRQPIRKPWFLSGGISNDNIAAAAQTGAAVLDLNSKFETAPGMKDYDKLSDALSSIRGQK
ncbi:MAG: phosphoribosylanthranilate isomerase [Bacteroidales bacterium]|nr:phosphoribosylanthranilate isomerase [Bacteroidales bacterium]